MALSPLAFWFAYAPLFLSGFVLGVLSIVRGRTGGGIILLLASLVLGPVLALAGASVQLNNAAKRAALLSEEREASAQAQEAQKVAARKESLRALVFEDVRGEISGDFVVVEGRVRNYGAQAVSFVQVEVELTSSAGKVLDTARTYLVSSDSLVPQGAKQFHVMVRRGRGSSGFRYHIVDE